MLEVVSEQKRAASCGRAPGYSDFWVGGYVGVLKVRLDHPGFLAVGENHVVDLAVVLGRRRSRGVRRLRKIPAANKREGTRGIKGVRQRARQPCIAVGIEAVVPTQGSAE